EIPMRNLQQVAAVFFLFCMMCVPARAQSTFDVDAYRHFLAQHQDMEGSALLNEYPAPLLRKSVSPPVGQTAWLDSIRIKYRLTQDEIDLIAENGFMVTERLTAETFQEAYSDIWHKDLPVAVTTDAILHALHMSYDNILKETERGWIIPELRAALEAMYGVMDELDTRYAGREEMRPMLQDVDVYIAVAWKLLTGQTRTYYPQSMATVSELLAKIAAEQPAMYPLFSSTPRLCDFSQFTIRGHYTDSDELGRYFQSMIWIGRSELMLSKPVQHDMPQQKDEDIQRQIIDAYLLAEALERADSRETLAEIDRLLELLVGESDNVRMAHLDEMAAQLGLGDPTQLLDMREVDRFHALLATKSFAGQRINSQILYSNPMSPEQLAPPSAFLLLGQRFIIDSYVFGNVVYDKIIHKGQKVRRMLPTSMDALFALGNDAAAQFLQDEFARYPYAANLTALRYLVDSYGEDFWSASLYNSWLHGIRALNIPDEIEHLPAFMQTAAWWQQKMNTQLASWAQLRHDNLLYAKQSYSGGITCSFPEGYVEPFPEFYRRLALFARKAGEVYAEPMPHVASFFGQMAASMDTLETIAQKELASAPLTAQEAGFVTRMLYTRPVCGIEYDGWYVRLFYPMDAIEKDYVVADVHTAPTDATGAPVGWVYHVGTGRINLGVIVANDGKGAPTAYVAPMLSFHEHVTTNFDRLTDERWEEMLDGKRFPRPEWTNNWLADPLGSRRLPGPSLMTGLLSVDASDPAASQAFTLDDVHPNPFRADDHAVLSYRVRDAGDGTLRLSVYDMLGRRVRTLLEQPLSPGSYMTAWEGRDEHGVLLPAGGYVAVLEGAGQRVSTKVLLLR
ncbi:MAG: DUF3160 domain-containing protein, partial [Bacteroidota bacterium]|nr:DUF3160 domain-containing protein [Bacteroidota bacterium]